MPTSYEALHRRFKRERAARKEAEKIADQKIQELYQLQGRVNKRLARERKARKEAESVAEEKTLDLFNTNQELTVASDQMRMMTHELHETLRYLSAIMSNLADGLLVTDVNGNISHYNPPLLSLFGLNEENSDGYPYKDVFGDEMTKLIDLAVEQPNGVFSGEVELVGARVGKAVSSGIVGDEDEALGAVVLVRDITQEKEVDRMKTDFISTVSHELRTPLTSILGFTKIIRKRLDEVIFPLLENNEDSKVQRATKQVDNNIDIIMAEGDRLTSLINDVLDVAKMEAGKIDWKAEPLSIAEVVDRAIIATTALFENKDGVDLVKHFDADLPQIEGDRDRLIQVVINLISNAVKFTDAGMVTCRVERVESDVMVSVSDTGVGIADEDLPKVFEKFRQVGDTLTDKPQGTGLGLPISKEIIEHHGGQIWVESEPHKGSTFIFTIPGMSSVQIDNRPVEINALLKQLRSQVASPVPGGENGHKTILVVDDEQHIRELLRQELEAVGHKVEEAVNGLDAIQKVKEYRPDLIILDVMMPEINGFDVAAVLKNDPETMDVPIIILSIVEDKERGFRLGVDAYLSKPIDTQLLFGEIDHLLTKSIHDKKIIVLDEDKEVAQSLAKVLRERGYYVEEVYKKKDLMLRAISVAPDMIIVDSEIAKEMNLMQNLRFEKGLEDVFILQYQ